MPQLGDSMPDEPILGGFHVCRPEPIYCKVGEEFGLRLMSDLHIGAANVDYKLIERELKEADEKGDRVLINGDLLDMILPKDAKRYNPANTHPRIVGRTDMLNAAVEWAVEILSPYACQIDLLAIGNHEERVTHWHGVDPTLLVIYELEKVIKENRSKQVIHYGGYTGFVDYRMRQIRGDNTSGGRWVLYYHHGSGAGAPVTKGMIDFNRKDTWIDADAIWMGHKHCRWNGSVEKLSCPKLGDQPTIKEVRHVMTGGYFSTYIGQSQESVRKHGRRSNYAADAGLAPQGRGGARVILTSDKNSYVHARVEQ